MSKSKTIIAGLGVVAALGVAALPLASYADQAAVSGNVLLAVQVEPAIAMTITGNNDTNSHYAAGATTGGITLYSDTEQNTSGKVDVDSTFTSTATATNAETETDPHSGVWKTTSTALSSSWAKMLPNSVIDGSTATSTDDGYGFQSTVTVYTNSTTGYTLAVEDSDSTTALTRVGGTETIPAGNTLTAGTAAWAYKVAASAAGEATGDAAGTVETGKNAWTAITANGSAAQIAHQDTKTIDGTGYVISYGVATDEDQATGTYTDTIIYTATTK